MARRPRGQGNRTSAKRTVPDYIVEYFLLGRTRRDAIEQFLQDGGIVTDVWLEFARDLDAPVRVLVAPADGRGTIDLAHALHGCLRKYRQLFGKTARERTNISPLESYVAATIYFDELLHVLLPLTRFYEKRQLRRLRQKVMILRFPLEDHLEREIKARLGVRGAEAPFKAATGPGSDSIKREDRGHWAVIEAAPVAALIGVFSLARAGRLGLPAEAIDPRQPANAEAFAHWVSDRAEAIANAATQELMYTNDQIFSDDEKSSIGRASLPKTGLISRIFLDRKARPAHDEAICTIKADAAKLLFEISCRDITWAIIDTGIASTHPAFFDHDAENTGVPRPSRVLETYDFTLIDQIRNFDLIENWNEKSRQARAFVADIDRVIDQLLALGANRALGDKEFRKLARHNLTLIAEQLSLRLRPDWRLIEPLIRLLPDDGATLLSDHGTHVAGTLGADWCEEEPPNDVVMKGMCPDIRLYDLRVIPPRTTPGADLSATESAVVAAIEFVQYLNRRAMADTPVVHGVNISLSIPHDVRNYGCGATPICVACDRLAGAGVVVVAAAGNRGWNEQELGFGTFVFCSITDPGNARDVITVGSTHRLKPHVYGVSYFSSRGPTGDGRVKPDLVAPGEQIRAPIRGGAEGELSGTSMAAPYVSGAAAMLMARRPELIGRALEVKKVLCENAIDLERERYFQGHGLLDVLRALQSQ